MVNTKSLLTRSTAVLSVVALAAAASVPALFSGIANAGIPTPRSITMSTSASSATSAGTDVNYEVAFTTATTGTIQGIVVEFCSNSPILGDSCTAPGGFDVNESGLAISDTIAGGAFTIDALTDANTLILTRTDATVINSATAVTLTLGGAGGSDGVTNPNTDGTFYARIVTYVDNDDDGNGCSAADDNATCYTATTVNDDLDSGGVALSTAARVTITAKVAERLSFCVFETSCGTPADLSLGDTNGILDPAGPFVNKEAQFSISTNAQNNAVVVIKGDTLTSGGFNIESSAASGTGVTGNTAYTSTAGAEQFGFCAEVSSGSGLSFSAPYNDANCSSTTDTAGTGATGGNGTAAFGFDTANATGTSGSTVATKTAGATSVATLAFIGNISSATEAGIYNTTLTFIATGSY